MDENLKNKIYISIDRNVLQESDWNYIHNHLDKYIYKGDFLTNDGLKYSWHLMSDIELMDRDMKPLMNQTKELKPMVLIIDISLKGINRNKLSKIDWDFIVESIECGFNKGTMNTNRFADTLKPDIIYEWEYIPPIKKNDVDLNTRYKTTPGYEAQQYKILAFHVIYDTDKKDMMNIVVCIESNPNGDAKAYYRNVAYTDYIDMNLIQSIARTGQKFYKEHAEKLFPDYNFEQ